MPQQNRIKNEAFRLYKLYYAIDNGLEIGDEYSGMTIEQFAKGPYRDAQTILILFSRTNRKNAPPPYTSWVRAWIACFEDNTLPIEDLMGVSIDDLDFSFTAKQKLKQIGITTIGQITQKTTGELKKRLGAETFSEVKEILGSYGIEIASPKKKQKTNRKKNIEKEKESDEK